MKISERLRSEVVQQFASCEAKWVLANSVGNAEVQKVLDEAYVPVETEDTYTLYRLKENA